MGSGASIFGYAGEAKDATDLIFLRARYYNPAIGRFFVRDSWPGSHQMPGTLHPYLYGMNNPILYTDPSGRCADPLTMMLCGAALGAGIGFIGSFAGQAYQNYQSNGGNFWNAISAQNINWGQVGAATAAGAVAGGVGVVAAAITAAGLGVTAASAATMTLGQSVATGATIGVISGALSGGAGQLSYNAMTGAPNGLFAGVPQAMLAGGALGGVGGAVGGAINYGVNASLRGLGSINPDPWGAFTPNFSGNCPNVISSITYVTPGGAALPDSLLETQGTSPTAGNFTGLEGKPVSEIVARVPRDWTWSAMASEGTMNGGGVKFTSPDGLREIRIHGPTNNPNIIAQYPNDPGVKGWTVRVGEQNPGYVNPADSTGTYADKWGFIYRDTFGNIVRLVSAAGHIPIQGNPFLGSP